MSPGEYQADGATFVAVAEPVRVKASTGRAWENGIRWHRGTAAGEVVAVWTERAGFRVTGNAGGRTLTVAKLARLAPVRVPCARCRKLTAPGSLADGVGPECSKILARQCREVLLVSRTADVPASVQAVLC